MNRTLLLALAATGLVFAVAGPAVAACTDLDCIDAPRAERVCSDVLQACIAPTPNPVAPVKPAPNPFEPCTCPPID